MGPVAQGCFQIPTPHALMQCYLQKCPLKTVSRAEPFVPRTLGSDIKTFKSTDEAPLTSSF